MAVVLALATSCGALVDHFDATLNPVSDPPPIISTAEGRYHETFLIADLHADTLMWRRGLAEKSKLGQVDLDRLVEGNVGLQDLTMPTRVPDRSSVWRCTHARSFDPAPVLAAASGWPFGAWWSPYERARAQANELQRVVDKSAGRTEGLRVRRIESANDVEAWLKERYANGGTDKNVIAAVLGVEGAHAFASDLGEEFETLVKAGLRLVGPTHHFTNVYGGSSEGCERPRIGLTDAGQRLVRTLFAHDMIVDLAHGSSESLADAAVLAHEAKRPLLVSHTGIREYLRNHPFAGDDEADRQQSIDRATPAEDVAKIAGTGGTVGIIYWEEQIGGATVENVAGSIVEAYCGLIEREGSIPPGGFHRIRDASEHVSLGSDWDGAAKNAVDAAHVGAITARLKALGMHDHAIANIVGRNACRVIVQSLSGGAYDYDRAMKLCSSYGPKHAPESDADRHKRQHEICTQAARN